MPSLTGIRRRIKSAKNISQITKAMEMVSASKMRKAQDAALSARPFTDKLEEIMSKMAGNVGEFTHPLMTPYKKIDNVMLIQISTDKGLCGGLNVNLFRAIADWASKLDPQITIKMVNVGKRAKSVIPNKKTDLTAKFHDIGEHPTFEETRAIARLAMDSYLDGQVQEVYIAYPKFISTLQNEPVLKKILPMETEQSEELITAEYAIEPNPKELIEELVPYQVEMSLYQMLIEARASEHSARMVAMKSASDNASELIDNLTLDYNQARQSAVTTELLDATTARMALNE